MPQAHYSSQPSLQKSAKQGVQEPSTMLFISVQQVPVCAAGPSPLLLCQPSPHSSDHPHTFHPPPEGIGEETNTSLSTGSPPDLDLQVRPWDQTVEVLRLVTACSGCLGHCTCCFSCCIGRTSHYTGYLCHLGQPGPLRTRACP